MARRPCIEGTCPRLAPPGATRCTTCEQTRQRDRNARRTHYQGDWPRISRTAIAAHRAQHGDRCPGYQRPPHPASDLTADHVDPRSLAAGVTVLCRSCNASKGSRPTPTA